MTYLITAIQRKLLILVFLFHLSNVYGQVPVHEEPRHHPVFQNKEIRILNVLLPPGDTTQYHLHHTPSFFINFTSTATGSQLMGGAASNGRSKAGSMLFENLAAPNTRIHRVWNNDRDTFHVMDVELLYSGTGFRQKPLKLPGLTLEVDTAWVRAYRVNLANGKEFVLANSKASFLLVSFNDAVIQTRQNGKLTIEALKQGSFIAVENGQGFSIKNNNNNTIKLVLLEFPVQ